MSAANKDLVARLHTAVLDTGDLAPIDELIHPDYLNHEAAPGTPRGRLGSGTPSSSCAAASRTCAS